MERRRVFPVKKSDVIEVQALAHRDWERKTASENIQVLPFAQPNMLFVWLIMLINPFDFSWTKRGRRPQEI